MHLAKLPSSIAVAALWWMTHAAAQAQTAMPSMSLARARFEEGRVLEKAQRFSEAIDAFDESQRLDPEPGTLVNIAACHDALGETAQAWIAYKEAARLALGEGRADWARRAEERASELQRFSGHLVIQLPGRVDVEMLAIAIDGMAFPKTLWGEVVPVGLGDHEVLATVGGRKRWSSRFEVRGPETVTVVLPPVDVVEPSVHPPPPPPVSLEAPPLAPRRVAAVAMGGISLASLLSGAALVVAGHATYAASGSVCGARVCEGDGAALRARAISEVNIGDVALVVGSASLLSAAALWWSGPGRVRVGAALGPADVRVVAGGSW